MAGPKAPLATLLIISAIDLLLCCFTMGVMLFLVFQPSQRNDASLSLLSSTSGNKPFPSRGPGSLNSALVIIVDNLEANLLDASKSPGFEKKSQIRTAASGVTGSATFIFIAKDPSAQVPLVLASNGTGATRAKVSVASGGHLYRNDTPLCDRGAQGSITFEDSVPTIAVNCIEAPQSTICPLDVNQTSTDFDIEAQDVDPQKIRLILAPGDPKTELTTSPLMSCFLTPVFDGSSKNWRDREFKEHLWGLAQECNASIQRMVIFATREQTDCVLARLPGKSKLRGSCFSKWTLNDEHFKFALLMFARKSTQSDGCTKVRISP